MQGLGRHILVDFYGVASETLNDLALVERALTGAAQAASATLINTTVHHFAPFGVSGVVVIQESHLSIHTWPEFGYAAADIFTCGESIDPWLACRAMEELLQAQSSEAREVPRGKPERLAQNAQHALPPKAPAPATPQHSRNVWFTERERDIALSLRHHGDPIWKERSPWQLVEIYESYAYGKFLALDGHIMFSEQDESAYHEMLVHIPMCSTPHVRNVAVLGGGDGGAVRELLKHQDVQRVDVVEIDECVVRAVERHFPANARALRDPRCVLHIAEASDWLARQPEAVYDLLILDTSDPRGTAETASTPAAATELRRLLAPDGLLMARSASPRWNADWFRESFAELGAAFGRKNVHCCLVPVPTYPSGIWSLAWCSRAGGNPVQDFDSVRAAGLADWQHLRYYNAAVHKAAFALPNYVRQLLEP